MCKLDMALRYFFILFFLSYNEQISDEKYPHVRLDIRNFSYYKNANGIRDGAKSVFFYTLFLTVYLLVDPRGTHSPPSLSRLAFIQGLQYQQRSQSPPAQSMIRISESPHLHHSRILKIRRLETSLSSVDTCRFAVRTIPLCSFLRHAFRIKTIASLYHSSHIVASPFFFFPVLKLSKFTEFNSCVILSLLFPD